MPTTPASAGAPPASADSGGLAHRGHRHAGPAPPRRPTPRRAGGAGRTAAARRPAGRPRAHRDAVDAERADLRQRLAPRALAHRRHRHHRGHAEDDAEDREDGAQLVQRAGCARRGAAARAGTASRRRLRLAAVAQLDHRAAARAASASLCVTRTTRAALARAGPSSRRAISSPVALSRLPVGSSASSRRGSVTSARAMATRWASPPESSDGRWSARGGEPDALEAAAGALAPLARGHLAVEQRRLDVLEHGELRDQVEGLEDEADAAVAQARELLVVEAGDRLRRRAGTRRRSGGRGSPGSLSSVDLPEPDGPMIATQLARGDLEGDPARGRRPRARRAGRPC